MPKKKINEEELDRELALRHGPAFMDCVRAKIGKKALTFYHNEKHIHQDYKGRDERITFKKSAHNGDSLAICVEWNEFKYERCSLGHLHQSGKEAREYKSFHIDWSYVDQLIEWIQQGTWTEQTRTEPRHVTILTEAKSLIEQLKAGSGLLKPSCTKIINKINEELGRPEYQNVGGELREHAQTQ